jgi:hypothetical protein
MFIAISSLFGLNIRELAVTRSPGKFKCVTPVDNLMLCGWVWREHAPLFPPPRVMVYLLHQALLRR